MTENENSCDIRIWCEDCQRCDYTTIGDKYVCATCGKFLHLDRNVHQAEFTIITDEKDRPS